MFSTQLINRDDIKSVIYVVKLVSEFSLFLEFSFCYFCYTQNVTVFWYIIYSIFIAVVINGLIGSNNKVPVDDNMKMSYILINIGWFIFSVAGGINCIVYRLVSTFIYIVGCFTTHSQYNKSIEKVKNFLKQDEMSPEQIFTNIFSKTDKEIREYICSMTPPGSTIHVHHGADRDDVPSGHSNDEKKND